jgi:hypothetical protein
MAREIVTLTNTSNGTWRERFALNQTAGAAGKPLKLAGAAQWSIEKYPLRGGLSDGVDVVALHNGRLSIELLPTRGMGVWRAKCDGVDVGWASPVKAPVNPMFVNLVERGGLGWLSGFNELLCRCGIDSNGPPGTDVIVNNQGEKSTAELTLHGKIANIPAHQVDVFADDTGEGTLGATAVVDETMLFGPCWRMTSSVTTQAGSNSVLFTDEFTNMKGTPAELEMLYHWNFGRPFLDEHAKLVVPASEVAPRDPVAAAAVDTYAEYAAPKAGFVEQVYFFQLVGNNQGQTRVLLRNAHGDKGVSLKFNLKELPCFTVWKNTGADVYGYVTGLEPGTNFPNPKTVERSHGRVVTVPAGGTYKTVTELSVLTTPEEVMRVEREIAGIVGDRKPTVHAAPLPKYLPKNG